jgi:hypothetical protein
MGNLPSTSVGNYKKTDNGFYQLENGKIVKNNTVCSDDNTYVTRELMKRCQPGDKCDIVKTKPRNDKKEEENCKFLVVNKDKMDGEYYRTKISNFPSGDGEIIYNDKNSDTYDSSKPSYRFIEKNSFDKNLEKVPEKYRLKSLYLQETITLGDMIALGEKYGNDQEKMFEDTKIPEDWCLSMDPCPRGIECCKDSFIDKNKAFFDKNKRSIIIVGSIVSLLVIAFFVYNYRSSGAPVAVSSKRRGRRSGK